MSAYMSGPERRQSPRQKAFLKGRINNGLGDVDCLIRDLSATGAKLMFSGGITMPPVIDLHIPMKKQSMRAKVQWRNGDEMGVSFIEEAQAAPAPAYASYDDAELTERVAKLEAEIVALRKMVMRLRAELLPNQDLADTG
jgi:uncharacterized small protein (DUF1192 family)